VIRGRRLHLGAALVLLLCCCHPPAAVAARAAQTSGRDAHPPSAPVGGPLLSAAPPGGEADTATGPVLEADPLVANGLGSPSCRRGVSAEAAPSQRRNCETSGFAAAAAPTDDYGLDVHIDTGLLPLSGGSLLSTVQDLLVTPEWLGLVWLVHALVVMLDWAFTLEVLGASTGLASDLASAQSQFTAPLLGVALSIAAILVAHHGLVQRRVAQTLGELALTLAMVAAGMWLMLDPSGTVGAISRWSDRAALGTLAVAAEGSPQAPGRALGAHLEGIFAAAIEGPWCYLEFGNVGWCRDTAALEAPLRNAAIRIAAEETTEAAGAGAAAGRLRSSARLLREARTNGQLFLALPANGPRRNSINDEGSLLRVLCASSNATGCTGTGASEAEFRTNSGTWPRVAGLVLIAAGLVGMLLLFGFVALRLLTAAVMSLLYLLMAPGVVVVPALGEIGRGLFRGWAGRLLAALVSKLLFAFLLGVLFGVSAVIEQLSVLGWWAQWLLLSAFWWSAFLRRHQLLAMPSAMLRGGSSARPQRAGRALRETLDSGRRTIEWRERRRERQHLRVASDVVRAGAKSAIGGGAPGIVRAGASAALRAGVASRRRHDARRRAAAATPADEQALRVLQTDRGARRAAVEDARQRAAQRAGRLDRIARAEHGARASGDRRRAVGLRMRAERLRLEEGRERALREGAATPRDAGAAARFLDRQAALPAAGDRTSGPRRDYPALAGLAHLSRQGYEQLAPAQQRAARLQIDRELAARRAGGVSRGARIRSPTSAGAATPPRAGRDTGAATAARRGRPPAPAAEESAVMRDARAVAEGRKRQLGIGRS
jgi:hypothetical protein